MQLQKYANLVFVGDSVTDCGRDYDADPAGWGSFGDGYVSLINASLTARYPDYEIMVANKGVNGNDILKMRQRWQKDVLDLKPDYVSILIGINDVWRHFDGVFQHLNNLVDLNLYRQTYQDLIDQTKPVTNEIFIMSPFMFEPNHEDAMRSLVDQYREVAESLARENHLVYIDVQEAVDHFLTMQSGYILSSDRVHPNLQGHMLVASTWLNAIYFDWKRG